MSELLTDLLAGSAAQFGERTAVVDGERRLTYAELEARANGIARALLDGGLARGDRVGLHLDKSLEAVVGIHGVLRAGGAYVPMDPLAPPARLAAIARDAGLHAVLSAGDLTDAAMVAQAPEVELAPDDLAYVLYTSGSTGAPKGVMLSHRNAMTFVRWATDEFAVTEDDRLSSHAPLHFDLSILDLFAAAAAGASVSLLRPEATLFPIEVARWIAKHEITVWYSVPSALTALALHGRLEPGALPHMRSVLFAGEVFPARHLAALMALLPHARFANLFGPTETNVCTWQEVAAPPDADVPIGRPIAGVDVVAVGEDGAPVAPGEPGELCVHGPSVMQGYWGDPERSAQVLAPLPAAGFGADPLYRTGDIVRQAPDGAYLFLGRRDSQVKRRGYRIELGEIERALESHDAVVECAARAEPDELAGTRITAYVVAREEVDEADLVAACLERIPRYAVPDAFAFRAELPKTSTGKIDRRALVGS